jgi:MFS family permease
VNEVPTGQNLLGFIQLSPGVRPSQVYIFTFVLLCSIWVIPFVILMQPLIISDVLYFPAGQQGVIIGALTTAQQAAFLVLIGLAGSLADVWGRRTMLILGLAGFALCMWFYPFVGSIAALFVARVAWGAADTCLSVGRVARFMDYPDNNSRGKFISLMMLLQSGASALFVAVVASRLPSWLQSFGLTKLESIRYAFIALSSIAVVGAAVAIFMLDDDAPTRSDTEEQQPRLIQQAKEIVAAFVQVFGHAKNKPRLAVVLLIGSVVRTDSVILTSFLGLWILHAASQQGIDSLQAVKTTGLLMSINGAVGFITPPIIGWLTDRMDRLTLLIGSVVLTGIAFCTFGLVVNVFSPWMIGVVVLVAVALNAQAISSNALLGEQAPAHTRGSVIGVFTALGVGSVLVVSLVAGFLFDRLGPSWPFVLEGMLCLTVSAVALALVRRRPKAIV